MRALTYMLVLFSASLYGFALTQPAFMSGDVAYTGWDCLSSFVFEFSAWYANPLLLIAWVILLLRHWSAIFFAAGALAAAISFTGLTPSVGEINELRAGYWLWMASITVALITGFVIAVESIVESSRQAREGKIA